MQILRNSSVSAIPVAALLFLAAPSLSRGTETASTPVVSLLHSFTGVQADGANPDGPLVIGPGGVLYGATFYGGSSIYCGAPGCGTIYSLTPPSTSGGLWTSTLIHDFGAGTVVDGNYPIGGLVIGTGNILYGVTYAGGSTSAGVVFSLTPPATSGQPWTETILYNFILGSKAGQFPASGLVINKKTGILYGTTYLGGSSGYGTVYSLTPPPTPGGAWTPNVILNFPGGSPGSYPFGALLLSNGVLYGTTTNGGDYGFGTIFSLTSGSGGVWTQTVLHSFGPPPADGVVPLGDLAIGSTGKLFGATAGGGAFARGTLFTLVPPTPPNTAWTESVLYSFTGGLDGGQPRGGVVWANGLLIGTTLFGGASNSGVVFNLVPPVPPSTVWTESVPLSFPGGAGGAYPQAGVVLGSATLIYGVTYMGGANNLGTVFSLQQQ